MISRSSSQFPGLQPQAFSFGQLAILVAVGAGMIALAFMVERPGLTVPVLIVTGAAMLIVGLVRIGGQWLRHRARTGALDLLNQFIENDSAPSFLTDDEGVVHARNSSARVRFPADPVGDVTMASLLRGVFANPQAILYRLQCRANLQAAADEDIVTRRGHVRLAVHRMGEDHFLWRVEDMAVKPQSRGGAENLPVPMLTVGRSDTVLFMNEAARNLLGGRVKALDRLFCELPVQVGRINRISTAEGETTAFVSERDGSAGRRELYLLPAQGDAATTTVGEAFDDLPVPMLRLSLKGVVLKANRLAVELLGAEPGPDTSLSNLMRGLGRPINDWVQEAAGSGGVGSEFLKLNRSDKEVFVQVILTRQRRGDEDVLVAVLSDATELKTLEAQFVQSQKMQAIGQLAGGVAHDFNNLLTAISGHCDLLLLRHDQGDPDYGDLTQINQNANRAAALVGQLLAFSRKQTLRPEVLDLRDTLSDLTHLLNRLVGEKVRLTLSHDPVLKPIRADKRQLEQVLMNLVVNARDAMPSGGEIRIETEVTILNEPLTRDRATVPAGEYVTVRVSDEGIGIQPDQLQKVFEPFFTTKRTGEGTGLGLSTAYGIVKQTGGFIFVDSVPASGTSFLLYFPVDAGDVEAPAVPAPARVAAAPRHGEGVVLLVEDEAPVRAFASRALRLRGYTVLEAESAEDALRTLEDPNLTVDVFVTDVVMPGMDGPSWVRQALKVRPEVRVVFVSGYAEGAFSDAEPAVPNSVFLPKPFSLNQLTETVHHQLH